MNDKIQINAIFEALVNVISTTTECADFNNSSSIFNNLSRKITGGLEYNDFANILKSKNIRSNVLRNKLGRANTRVLKRWADIKNDLDEQLIHNLYMAVYMWLFDKVLEHVEYVNDLNMRAEQIKTEYERLFVQEKGIIPHTFNIEEYRDVLQLDNLKSQIAWSRQFDLFMKNNY